jgi:hypothetical protein
MMRTLLICVACVGTLLSSHRSVAQVIQPHNSQRVYPETLGNDIVIDAPWRVKSASHPIPFELVIKDANDLAMGTGIKDLNKWRMSYRNAQGQDVWFYTHDFGGIPVTNEWFTYFAQANVDDFYNYDSNGDDQVCAGELGFAQGDVIQITAYVIYVDSLFSVERIFTKSLRVAVGYELPNIGNKWYYGDTHFHTTFTSQNSCEFGGTHEMTKASGRAIGISWVTTTDHAELPSEINYLDENTWGEYLLAAEEHSVENSFIIFAGEELYLWPPTTHFLVYNNGTYIGNNDFSSYDFSISRILSDVNAQPSAFAYASHPLDSAPWQSSDYNIALSFPSFMGLEAWNTRISGVCKNSNFTEFNQNPFPWDNSDIDITEWQEELTLGITRWDSLLCGKLSSAIPRKIFLSGGSDAHGDFNYAIQRNDCSPSLIPPISATNNAFAKVRTAVYCDDGMGLNGANVIDALRNGRSVVTDGPLIEFGIDLNNNGQIGYGDLRIGDLGNFNLNNSRNLIVNYESSEDFGTLDNIVIKVGHPSLGTGYETVELDRRDAIGLFSGYFSINLAQKLQQKGVRGWCLVRVEGSSSGGEYRCYTNPIWLNVFEGAGQVFFVTAWAGPNGEINPSGVINVPQASSVYFSALPDDGYVVDTWFLDGQAKQSGGTSYSITDVQAPHTVNVTFKAVDASTIAIIAPNGGETWFLRRSARILWKWEGSIGNDVMLELYRAGVFHSLIESSTPNDGQYQWSIPSELEVDSNYQLRVSALDGSPSDLSDGYFCIKQPVSIDTVRIVTCSDLQMVSTGGLNPPNVYYLLMNNIDARACGNFDPIGSGPGYYFRGVFDGQDHTITRLDIDRPGESEIGLFSVCDVGGVIKNLKVEIGNISGYRRVGMLVGENHGTISNCHTTVTSGNVSGAGGSDIGGMVGENIGGVIRNSSVNLIGGVHAKGDSPSRVGGLAGFNSGRIEWCWTFGPGDIDVDISGQHGSEVGGLVGEQSAGSILESYSSVRWIDAYIGVGGLVGLLSGGEIRNSYLSGSSVNAETQAGGIAGETINGSIDNCLTNGTINADDPSYEGALVGKHASTISNSFWCPPMLATGNGGIVLNCRRLCPDSLNHRKPYEDAGWNFDDIWAIDEGISAPELRGTGPLLSAPDAVSATTGQSDGIKVSWNAVSYQLAGTAYGAVYAVFRSELPYLDAQASKISEQLTTTSYLDTSAIPEVTYYYWVKSAATSDGARESAFSSIASGYRTYPPLDTPSVVTASDGMPVSVLVQWNGVLNANYYRVYRSSTMIGAKTPLGNWQAGLAYSDNPSFSDTVYYYWVVAAVDNQGNRASDYGGPDNGYFVDTYTDVDEEIVALLPSVFSISQNYPNPFNPSTVIEFDLPRRSHVTLTVCNILGQVVDVLVNREMEAGYKTVRWDGISSGGNHLATGIYFYRLATKDFTDSKKMILLK